jgi:hypothetical protein
MNELFDNSSILFYLDVKDLDKKKKVEEVGNLSSIASINKLYENWDRK